MRNKTLSGRSALEMPENWAKDCQVYGHPSKPSGRIWQESRPSARPCPGIGQMTFAPTELVGRTRTDRHKPKPLQKEERMTSRYLWRGIVVIVLGAVLIQSAAAQTGIGTGAAGSRGLVMSHSLEDIAAVVLIAIVYLHELFRILTLCQFAAPIPARSGDATNESARPPRHGSSKRTTRALGSVAKKSTAEMSLLGALIASSRKFG
jgi:hypothetical protein